MIPERPISEGYIGLSRLPPDCEPISPEPGSEGAEPDGDPLGFGRGLGWALILMVGFVGLVGVLLVAMKGVGL